MRSRSSVCTRAGACRLPAIAALLLAVGIGTACDGTDPVSPPGEPREWSFGFEQDMEGWSAQATDTLAPPIEWHVRHTTSPTHTGSGAVELHLENFNDAGKIWMERDFELEPGVSYQIELGFAFGTSDWGDVNLFTIIAGVHENPPREAEDLAFQDETGHDEGQDAGLVWQDRTYAFTATAPGDGVLTVAVGVWGTWETIRTYFVDDLTVVFTPVEG